MEEEEEEEEETMPPIWSRVILIATAVLTARTVVGSQDANAGPPVGLNPGRPHVWIYGPEHWNLKLYPTPAMKGLPAIELNDQGLFANGVLACSWPGGKWDSSHAESLVLGYAEGPAPYTKCDPADLPVISTWGDNGLGTAAVYIEVVARTGRIVEAEWRGRRLFLDLNALPGDPNDPKPPVRLVTKGYIGWEWMPSDRATSRRNATAFARLLGDPGFSRFFNGVRRCIRSASGPDCLVPFVDSHYYDSQAAEALGKESYVTAEEWARYAWTAKDENGGPLWGDMEECFFHERAVAVSRDNVQFGEGVLCNAERQHGKWKLTGVMIGE